MLFKEGGGGEASKGATPMGRRRLTNSSSQPQFMISSPLTGRKSKIPPLSRKKKASVPDFPVRSASTDSARSVPFQDDPHCLQIKEQVGTI